MKIIIAGGREFNNYELLREICDGVIPTLTTPDNGFRFYLVL